MTLKKWGHYQNSGVMTPFLKGQKETLGKPFCATKVAEPITEIDSEYGPGPSGVPLSWAKLKGISPKPGNSRVTFRLAGLASRQVELAICLNQCFC